ncbi:hypothetical protein SO802_015634 [Lithocarpus litseifolius]|uniref:Uncharacterized protein n=1 Tax=Lithocarpus litseifolius TaxID=425828 RepID=A0AAW2CWK9_9ROSI
MTEEKKSEVKEIKPEEREREKLKSKEIAHRDKTFMLDNHSTFEESIFLCDVFKFPILPLKFLILLFKFLNLPFKLLILPFKFLGHPFSLFLQQADLVVERDSDGSSKPSKTVLVQTCASSILPTAVSVFRSKSLATPQYFS